MPSDTDRVVTFAGDVDMTRSDDLARTIEEEVAADDVTTLTVDMTELTFLDSTGISLLLKARQLTNERQIPLTLKNPPHQTRRLLQLAGVAQLFTVDPP